MYPGIAAGTGSAQVTAGNVIETVSVLSAVSLTVTVATAVFAFAVFGVPLIAPVEVLMLNPDGSPVALYSSMSVPPEGLICVIVVPTFSDEGAVYVGAVGAVRSTVSVRSTALGAANPVLVALTSTSTLVPVM